MQLIREYLGDNLSYHDSCYKLIKKDILDDFFKDNSEEIRKFFHAIALIDPKVFGEGFKKYKPLLEEIKVQQKEVYLFLEDPFENLKHLELKEDLEKYILERRYINIEYSVDKIFKFKRVQPYKIIYQNGNWYLAVLTTEDYEVNGGFKLLRLNFIANVKACISDPYHFHEDSQVKEFLDNKFQSLFTSFDKKFFKVIVEVDESVARYFEVKDFLKSQKVIGKKDNKLLVEFSINDDMEILPLVQMWLPKIKIVEPLYLHERILGNIREFVNG
jgi:predicted DNA-binding transcriptional regulator YafY